MTELVSNIERISPINVIPEGCLCFMEETGYVLEAVSNDFDAFVEFCEMQDVVEEGAEIVNEAEDSKVKAIKDKAIGLITKFWQMIKKAFENVISWFKEGVKKAKEAMEKIATTTTDKAKGAADKAIDVDAILKMKDAEAKIAKIGTFKDCAPAVETATKAIKQSKLIINSLNMSKRGQESYDDNIIKLINQYFGVSVSSASELASAVEKSITDGPCNETTVSAANLKEMVGVWTNILFKDAHMKTLKENYNAIKNAVNASRAAVNKEIKAAGKDEKPDYTGYVNALMKVLAIMKKADAVSSDLLRTRFRQALKFYGRALKLSMMAKGEKITAKKVEESAEAPEVTATESVNFSLSDLF